MSESNVLYLVTEDSSGMRPYAATILKSVFNKKSWAVIVVRDKISRNSYSFLPQQNVIFVDYPKGKGYRLFWHLYPQKLVSEIKKVIKEHKIELVHALTPEISLAYVKNYLFQGVKMLYTVHDAISHDVKYESVIDRLKDKLLVKIPNRIMVESAKYLVTNSKPQTDYLQSVFPEKTVFYTPFPTLVNDSIKSGNNVVDELKNESDYILFFGSVNYYKGVHLLYNMYCKHKETFGNRKLVIAGAGFDYYEPIYSNDVIRINRYIDDSEIRYLFENASVVVYPYISATQSGVLSIATYFGKKILLSKIPFFMTEAKKNSAVLFADVTNEDDFLQSLQELLNRESESFEIYENIYNDKSLKSSIENVQRIVMKS